MADNYLEKRMEELMNGKLSLRQKQNSYLQATNRIQFLFPPKRIVILDGLSEEGYHIGETFRRAGCKVAFVTSLIKENHPKMFRKVSETGYLVCIPNTSEELASGLQTILTQWLGIDIIIDFDSPVTDISTSFISKYLSCKPSPSSYIPRLIHIKDGEDAKFPVKTDIGHTDEPLPDNNNGINDIFKLRYTIEYTRGYGAIEQLDRMIRFLSLPEAAFLKYPHSGS